jgi:hypothetical protein
MGAEMHARHAREAVEKAAREADRAEAVADGGLRRARAAVAQCLNGSACLRSVQSL